MKEYIEEIDGIEYLVKEYESGAKIRTMKPETVPEKEQMLLEMAANLEYVAQLLEMNMEV